MSDPEDTLDVYWRLYLDDNDQHRVVTMQWFDELDYDQGRFLSADRYDEEHQAQQALAQWIGEHPVDKTQQLKDELEKAYKAIDALWGEMTADSVKFLKESNAEVVNLCKRVHMILWHPEEDPDAE